MRDLGNGEMFNSTYFTVLNPSEHSRSNQELRKRDDSRNTFTNPPPTILNDPINKDYIGNPIYTEGSPFKVEWFTNLTNYGLGFIQDLLCNPECSSGATMLAVSKLVITATWDSLRHLLLCLRNQSKTDIIPGEFRFK